MVVFWGEVVDFFSFDSGFKLDCEIRWYLLGVEFFKDGLFGMKMKIVFCIENGSISFCGSFIVGSFMVVCMGSLENLFIIGGCVFSSSFMFSNVFYYMCSVSCNVGNLFGVIFSGLYIGGGFNIGVILFL